MSIPFVLSYAALWILVIVHSLILLSLIRVVYRLQQTGAVTDGEGRLTGQEIPSFSVVDVSGVPIKSTDFTGRLTALLFVSPNCASCTLALGEMHALNHKANGNVIVICRAGHGDCVRLAEEHKLNVPIAVDENLEISRLFDVSSVPTAVLINESNRIQSYGHPMRGEELDNMFETAGKAEIGEEV